MNRALVHSPITNRNDDNATVLLSKVREANTARNRRARPNNRIFANETRIGGHHVGRTPTSAIQSRGPVTQFSHCRRRIDARRDGPAMTAIGADNLVIAVQRRHCGHRNNFLSGAQVDRAFDHWRLGLRERKCRRFKSANERRLTKACNIEIGWPVRKLHGRLGNVSVHASLRFGSGGMHVIDLRCQIKTITSNYDVSLTSCFRMVSCSASFASRRAVGAEMPSASIEGTVPNGTAMHDRPTSYSSCSVAYQF